MMDTLIMDTLVRVDTVRVVDTLRVGVDFSSLVESASETLLGVMALSIPILAVLLPILVLVVVVWFLLRRERERTRRLIELLEKAPQASPEVVAQLLEGRPRAGKLVWGLVFLALGVWALVAGAWGIGFGALVLGLGLGLIWFFVDRRR